MRFQTLDEWLEWQSGLHPSKIELGLDRVSAVWQSLNPSGFSGKIITVAGTNGKGSCVAILESVLIAAGYCTGCYTSPHLVRYNERIRLNGSDIGDQALCEVFDEVDRARGDISLTYFEFGTLAALRYFVKQAAEVLVLEVGLGGRLDAVNILDADLALITSVDIDHTDWLGETRELIAIEKGGVMRPGSATVFGSDDPPGTLLLQAQELGSPLFVAGRDFRHEHQAGGWCWQWEGYRFEHLPCPRMQGGFQLSNASAVLMVLMLLRQKLPVARAAIDRGLQDAWVEGRFQVVGTDPTVILDVAHNPHASRALAENLIATDCRGRTLALFCMLEGKDVEGVVRVMLPWIDRWYLAGVAGERALALDELVSRVENAGVSAHRMSRFSDLGLAWEHIKRNARATDRVVVFGSFYLIGEMMQMIRNS
ncbi:MAG: bifunctional tetrahydrofolate synthase/dihydrofolate synthase [Gammaproteobacteria bacterium]|nr:bifunctional tetrahydrofolate synthase/dihydrofolate synthase [Gammaproteobacteria bacterium]